MELYILYYIFLLLLFIYFAKYHFPRMNSISTPQSKPTPVSDPNDQAREIPEDEFFHHPVWSERWYNPEFTDEGRAKWETESWYGSTAEREPHWILRRPIECFPWGFIIYRTVYTAESDMLWPLAMQKIACRLTKSIEGGLRCGSSADDPRPEQLVQASRKDVIICDADRWDGASIEQIRAHFAEYLRKINQVGCAEEQRFALCLVIDERSLKSMTATGLDDSVGFVGAVDGRFNPTKSYEWPRYRGFMRVKIRSLWDMYLNLHFDHMHEICPHVPDGWIPVYASGERVGHDESGQIERDFSQERPAGLRGRGRGQATL